MTEQDEQGAWTNAMTSLARAGDRFAAEMAALGNPVDSADVYATMLGALSDTYLNQIAVTADCPSFVPCTGYFQRLGSPNPDTVYRRAPIDPAGTYRLTGYRGTALDVTLMPFSQMMQSFVPFDLSDVADGEDGRLDMIVSAERPAEYEGNWLQLDPRWASLWLREVSEAWGEDEPARLAIMRMDSGSRTRPSAEATAAQLAGLAIRVERIVEYGIRHASELAAQGYVNRLKTVDYGASGGMPLQWYHEGIFEIGLDDCLLVEAQMPADLPYFSWSLTDRTLVTLDWANAHTSLNRRQAVIHEDGVLRVVLSHGDPGTPNWLQTAGYRSGVLQCRTVGSKAPPEIGAKVVPMRSVQDYLPKPSRQITADQRLEVLRRRQIGQQMRRLW